MSGGGGDISYQCGIRDKLWYLFKECFDGGIGIALYDGQLSTMFDVTRSIKQGGIMSMFLLTIYLHRDPIVCWWHIVLM